ncbi:hypothetical protein TIFTF001_018818 [Ficus carica]|uniref:Retrotransposon gag domain-containing protein n=1 Tax=Ficus carica TaxID=3494 RepID=A0AA88AC57_FICCA|nr:hypothetical protein TIFTF001_018818 [Ficus carica]
MAERLTSFNRGTPTTLGVVARVIFDINILALEGGPPPFQQSIPSPSFTRHTMDEHTNQDIQEYDNPAPTGSQSTRPPRRQRGARAQRKPTQTEILAGNVQAMTQIVQVLMEAFRDTHNVQLPQRQPEAAESTPSRPPRSASRRRDPSPTAARSGRSHRKSAGRQQHEEGEPSRMLSRSRRSRINLLEAPEHPDPIGDNPDDDCREVVNVRRNTPSVFDSLGRPEIYRRLGREASFDKSAERESRNQSRLDYLQCQLDRLVGQQYGLEPAGSIDPPFTPSLMASPYPSRFKMPTMPSYDGSTNADEHLENYQAHMLIQSANEAALCKLFCLTLTGAAQQWYRRLPPGSIDTTPRIDRQFLAAGELILNCIPWIEDQETGGLSSVRHQAAQERDAEEVPGAARREGIKDTRLVWTLAYDRPTSFAHLRGIAWRHTEADEYVRGRGLEVQDQDQPLSRRSERGQNRQDKGKNPVVETHAEANSSLRTPAGRFRQYTPLVTTIEHVLNQVSVRGLLRNPPPIRTDRSRRNQNKYCHFHKDVGHDTKDCIQLRDQIEQLIREGYLREFVEKIFTPARQSSLAAPATRQNPGPSNRIEELEPEHIVHTIFGGTATGDTASSRRSYAREARWFARGEHTNMAEHISKICRQDSPPITFTDDEADWLLHPHNEALVGEIRVANNVVRRVLIDNGSSTDVIIMDAFSRLKIEGATLTPAQTPLYGFSGDCIRAAGTVHLPVTIGDGPEKATRMVEFIIVDRPSIYNVILGRPTLNALKAMVSTYHLAMKFPTGDGIGVFRGNQEGARKCYMEAVNKVCRKAPAPATVATILAVDEAGAPSGEVKPLADLDPRIPEEDIRALPVLTRVPRSWTRPDLVRVGTTRGNLLAIHT